MKFGIVIVLLVVAVVTAPLGWYLAASSLRTEEPSVAPASADELARLRAEVESLSSRIGGLEARLAQADPRPVQPRLVEPGNETTDSLADSFAKVVQIADRRSVNAGLTHASSSFLSELLGLPREDLNDECQDMTNEKLLEILSLEDVGPIKVRMLKPAIASLRQVFRNVQVYEPELYSRIQGSGTLCVRRVRGAADAASAHAYGLAVDLNIDGVLDTLGDGKTQLGLILLADFFQKEGWYWGAGFGREDSMHFEVSREKLEQWRSLGLI